MTGCINFPIKHIKLYDYLYYGLCDCFHEQEPEVRNKILLDYENTGLKGQPEFTKHG